MIFELTENILFQLKKYGIETKEIDWKSISSMSGLSQTFQKPSVNITVTQGTWGKVGNEKGKWTLLINLFLVVHSLRSEKDQKKIMYTIIESITDALLNEKFDMPITELKPVDFKAITPSEYEKHNVILYQMDFKTSLTVAKTPEDQQDLGKLEAIYNNYYLNPEDDGILDLEGDVSLIGAYGGTASDVVYSHDFFGGSAGTVNFSFDLYGGNAGSTYNAG